MILELVRLVEQELGTALPNGCAHRIEAALCQQFGGERVYVQKLPKLVHQVRLASLGTGTAAGALGQAIGRSPSQVRRILRGTR